MSTFGSGPARRAKRTGNIGYDASLAATQAQADVAGEDFERDVGERLGGLNAIGALRSGGANQAVQQAGSTYATRIGQAAAGNAMQFGEMEERKKMEESARNRDSAAYASQEDWRKREFEEGKRRFDTTTGNEQDRFGKTFGEDVRRFDTDSTYRGGRATRADLESDRGFTEDTRRFDYEGGFREGRTRRADFESDRGYGEDVRRDDRNFGRTAFENDRSFTSDQGQIAEDKRRYEVERQEARAAQQRAKKRSMWGALGTVAGAGIGFAVGGPAGAALGAKAGGALGGR